MIDLTIGRNRKQRITVEVDGDFRDSFDKLNGEELTVEIKKYRRKRSLNANAYFHVLLNKISTETGESEESIKVRLVLDYGPLAKNSDGTTLGFMVPATADVATLYKYIKCFDTREINGTLFRCYLVYKHTSDMDSKEMARLIDGAIQEARELGIETDTPEQLSRFKEQWSGG